MAVTSRAQLIDRNELALFLKTPRLIKQIENVVADVVQTIPGAVDELEADVQAAQATADQAILDAAAAQADANQALTDAATAQSTVDALALRDVPLALVDAANIAVNAAARNSFSVTLGGNRTLDAPSNLSDGMLLNFAIRQDGTGGRTLAFNAIYDFGDQGAPVLSTTASAVDYVSGYYDSTSGLILCRFRKSAQGAASFSAHNNGVNQNIPDNAFTKLTFSTEAFDVGNCFAASSWTPPAGKPVMMIGAVALVTAVNTLTTIAIYKNGAEYKRGVMVAAPNTTTHVVQVTCIDIPNGTDVYDLYAYQNTGAPQNTNGVSNLTYFQGTTLTP